MKRFLAALSIVSLVCSVIGSPVVAQELALDDLFPTDRVLDVRITVDEKDWNRIRYQTRDLRKELAPERQQAPIPGPYTWVSAQVSIDGVELGKVGLRKKGFLGSQSTTRPSLKIKLDYEQAGRNINGLESLTLNNNRQDRSLICQYLGYALFNAAGSPAPRCSFAQVTVNGNNLGVYSHVETCRQPLVARGFGDDSGTMYEGTVVDFFPDWAGSFELKFGDDRPGRQKISQLISALNANVGDIFLAADSPGTAWIPDEDRVESGWTDFDFDDSEWISGRGGAGYENQSGYEQLINSSFDFQEELFEESTSLFLRYAFELEEQDLADDGQSLLLDVKYDDGFVAWLNGRQIASVNAPRDLRWDSKATGSGDDRAALQFESFDISDHRQHLKPGKNVLAIQALNVDPGSSDMLCVTRIRSTRNEIEQAIGQHVDLDAFYRFWVIEGLTGFWDGYTANRNNFFVYLNPATNKLHFVPWGADSLFVKHGYLPRDRREPLCVKTTGIVAYKLYQSPAGRARYAAAMNELLETHWNEDELLDEVDRLEELIRPHLADNQVMDLRATRQFIRSRRADVEREIAEGLPAWTRAPGPPPVIPAGERPRFRRRPSRSQND